MHGNELSILHGDKFSILYDDKFSNYTLRICKI
jgi:hypothetical protein